MFVLTMALAGCHKKRTIANFGLKAGMTEQEVADQMGSPTKSAGNWVAYAMEDGSELRLYFLEGKPGGTRTLSEADLYTGSGPSLTITKVFKLPRAAPATRPVSNPATKP
jgi:hypothetical protein